jgi:hypothetical protein
MWYLIAGTSSATLKGISMKPEARAHVLGIVLGSVPDLFVSWAAMRLTDTGWSGFFIALVALQAIYLFFWLKTALWSWLVFWIHGKRQVAAYLESWFIENHFPVPDKYTADLDDYLSEISNNEALDATMRTKAALELGALNGFKGARKFSMFLQMNVAGGVAMKRYARLANRFTQ